MDPVLVRSKGSLSPIFHLKSRNELAQFEVQTDVRCMETGIIKGGDFFSKGPILFSTTHRLWEKLRANAFPVCLRL